MGRNNVTWKLNKEPLTVHTYQTKSTHRNLESIDHREAIQHPKVWTRRIIFCLRLHYVEEQEAKSNIGSLILRWYGM